MEDVVQWSVGAGFVSLFDTNRQDMHGNILNLVPCFPPSARLQGVVVQHKAPRKGQNEFFQNMSHRNTHSLWWHPKKEDRNCT